MLHSTVPQSMYICTRVFLFHIARARASRRESTETRRPVICVSLVESSIEFPFSDSREKSPLSIPQAICILYIYLHMYLYRVSQREREREQNAVIQAGPTRESTLLDWIDESFARRSMLVLSRLLLLLLLLPLPLLLLMVLQGSRFAPSFAGSKPGRLSQLGFITGSSSTASSLDLPIFAIDRRAARIPSIRQ